MKKFIVAPIIAGVLIMAGCTPTAPVAVKPTTPAETPVTPVIHVPVAHKDVTITSPDLSKPITSPLKLTGMVKPGYSFEATFPLSLQDANGKVLGTGHGTVNTEDLDHPSVPFTAEITFTKPATSKGKLIVKNDNPSGMPENDKSVSFDVIFLDEHVAARKEYVDTRYGFKFSYPTDFTSGKAEGALVAVNYPESDRKNTNLTEATIMVKVSSDLNLCAVSERDGEKLNATKVINGVTFYKDKFTDPAAGNVYEQVAYYALYKNNCYKVILLMHSINIALFDGPVGSHAFDRAAVVQKFEDLIETFQFS